MYSPRSLVSLLLLLQLAASAAAQGSNSSWLTLAGDAPFVIARGGFSGLVPDSSSLAYQLAGLLSKPNTAWWCDVQLTKDGVGICFPDLKLDNSSDIANLFTDKQNEYPVNGLPTKGWFSVDFTFTDLANVYLTQGIYSRSPRFNGMFPIITVEDVAALRPPSLWLNIQHDAFFRQHNLSMRSYVLSVSRRVVVKYISSPEVNFLKSIMSRFNPKLTKLVFRFLQKDVVEPTTNQTYASLLANLTFIKTFASGILVPKAYIWPMDVDTLYLQPHTSVVSDAHKEGLEVFASDFANDVVLSYNYSYDPVAEYLNFVDNGDFSVDGVLSDFPITPSAAIDCFSHMEKNDSGPEKPLIISHNGASGDFPGCTDLAYMRAIADGVDVIDCPVQMTKDGIPICLSSINLIQSTDAAQSSFSDLSRSIPEIKGGDGIFTFDLNWSDYRMLKPEIFNPYPEYQLYRNPKNRNAGTFVTLSDFLALPKNSSSISRVLISIENAAYLAGLGMSVTDAVLDALSKAGYDNQTATKIMIQSTNSSVLMKFKAKNGYELVYDIDEIIRDVLNSAIEDIKKVADSVVIKKTSIYATNEAFITHATDVVPKLHSYKLQVYARLFRNEFVSQAWDYFSDATVEINSFVLNSKIDGVITDFPKTAVSYRKNRCLNLNDTPVYMQPVEGGSLLSLIAPPNLPPAEAPLPVLTDSDVIEAPLASVTNKVPSSGTGSGAPTSSPKNGQPKTAACIFLPVLAMLLAIPLLLL